jgi:hypothetical protein
MDINCKCIIPSIKRKITGLPIPNLQMGFSTFGMRYIRGNFLLLMMYTAGVHDFPSQTRLLIEKIVDIYLFSLKETSYFTLSTKNSFYFIVYFLSNIFRQLNYNCKHNTMKIDTNEYRVLHLDSFHIASSINKVSFWSCTFLYFDYIWSIFFGSGHKQKTQLVYFDEKNSLLYCWLKNLNRVQNVYLRGTKFSRVRNGKIGYGWQPCEDHQGWFS